MVLILTGLTSSFEWRIGCAKFLPLNRRLRLFRPTLEYSAAAYLEAKFQCVLYTIVKSSQSPFR